MTTYLSPGVYIEEIPSGPQPIAAVSPSVLAVVGTTERGPVGEPTRVTGWGGYVARFGGSVPNIFTAEAVAAFFENGGPAAYIVRVDPSAQARWVARTVGGDDAFTIEASSPGEWANDVSVSIVPWLNGGVGRPWTSQGRNAAGTTVDVGSTAGLAIGDTITTIDGAAEATIDTITGSTLGLTINAGAIGDFDAQLMIVQNSASIRLATNPGVEVGDVLEIRIPGAMPAHHTVTAIDTAPGATTLDLDGAANLPGGSLAPRTARYRARLTNPGLVQANLGHFDFEGRPAAVAGDMVDGMRAYFANGLIAQWNTDHFELLDTASPNATRLPMGTVEIEGPIRVATYAETGLSIDNPTLETLATQFSWVPDGLRLELFSAGGSEATIEKDGTDFTLEAGGLAFNFDEVRYDANGTPEAIVTAPFPVLVGDTLDLDGGDETVIAVDSLGGDRYHITLAGGTANQGAADVVTAFQQTRVVPYRFAIVVTEGGGETRYENLALPEGHSRYFARDGIVNDESPTIKVIGSPAATDFADMPVRADQVQLGSNVFAGAQHLADGFDLLEAEPEPAILICPDVLTLEDPMLQGAVIGAMTTHAETFRRFAIVDLPREGNDQDLVDWRLEHVNSNYAAAYAPHVRILNLDTSAAEQFRWVPPSGSVAGVFARTDSERGVFKAPANERVRGIVGLDQEYTQRRQDLLNPNGVNVIRVFPGRGRRIWGARTASTDIQWRYVNVRRLFNVIETSIERGTQWVVFEPNTASTWLRVRASVENFLNGVWQAGGLAGSSPDEAYRVRVGLGETMTEDQVNQGLIIIRVAVAAARPAEFVVFQFTHKQITE